MLAPGLRAAGPVRSFSWQGDGSGAGRSSMGQDAAGAGRRDNRVVDAGSRSSTCPHARRRCSGRPGSLPPAAARKRSGRSGPTPDSM